MKEFKKDKKFIFIILMWIISAVIIFTPYGVMSQMKYARIRADKLMEQSPYNRLCYKCSRPATHKQTYQLSTHYFCDKHWPPPESLSWNWLNYIFTPEKGLNALFVISIVLLIYLPNYFRVIFHFLSRRQRFKLTISGSIWTVVGALIFWIRLATYY